MNRETFIAALVAAAFSTSTDANPFGPDHGFDAVYAVIENAREAPPDGHLDWRADVFEHSIGPETAPQLVERVSAEPGALAEQDGQKSSEASHQPGNRKE